MPWVWRALFWINTLLSCVVLFTIIGHAVSGSTPPSSTVITYLILVVGMVAFDNKLELLEKKKARRRK